MSQQFTEPTLFIRALYLESAVFRALAGKENDDEEKQSLYQKAVLICEEAATVYSNTEFEDQRLKGKIYFNLGAAHADNPKRDLEKATHCYLTALECFENISDDKDIIRVSIRLGKVYLLQKKYESTQQVLAKVRAKISDERLAMHADYLEAQLKFALKDSENAIRIAKNGLVRAKKLGAKEDGLLLRALLQSIEDADWIMEGEKCAF